MYAAASSGLNAAREFFHSEACPVSSAAGQPPGCMCQPRCHSCAASRSVYTDQYSSAVRPTSSKRTASVAQMSQQCQRPNSALPGRVSCRSVSDTPKQCGCSGFLACSLCRYYIGVAAQQLASEMGPLMWQLCFVVDDLQCANLCTVHEIGVFSLLSHKGQPV